MNHDTISRLSEIAAKWSYEKYSKTETGYTRKHWYSYKLAELIVEECVDRIKRVGILEDIEIEGDMISDAVKEHFEVEE